MIMYKIKTGVTFFGDFIYNPMVINGTSEEGLFKVKFFYFFI